MKRYSVRVGYHGSHEYMARSASAARYMAFRAFRDAGYSCTFRQFLHLAVTYHLGAVEVVRAAW